MQPGAAAVLHGQDGSVSVISLDVVTWLIHCMLFVGQNTLVVSILEEPSVPVLLWNTGLAIPNPGMWAFDSDCYWQSVLL